MKRLMICTGVLLMLAGFARVEAQDLDQVLGQYFKTIGQDKMLELNAMQTIGKSIVMGMEVPYTSVFKRPDKYYLEVEIQGAVMKQAYDGKKAWMTMPWTGSTDPRELQGPELKSLASMADFDGPLYNFKEKGYKVEFIGKDEMEGTEVYKIKVDLGDDMVQTMFIDAENYVMLKQETRMMFQGNEINSEILMSNYKDVDGMLMPHNLEMRSGGNTSMQILIEKYLLNPEVDDTTFTMPSVEKKDEGDTEDK